MCLGVGRRGTLKVRSLSFSCRDFKQCSQIDEALKRVEDLKVKGEASHCKFLVLISILLLCFCM